MASERPFLTARWRYLAMLNYAIDPAVLRPFVPKGTELDTWEGRTFVSMVGFLFHDTRVLGFPIPFHRNFEEVNLRFYVRRRAEHEWRRGVVFIKEIVPRTAIALVARAVYGENYVAMPMGHDIEWAGEGLATDGAVEYTWGLGGGRARIRVKTSGPPSDLVPGSLEQFIAEHYWGYAVQRGGETVEYEVEHPPWQIRQTSTSVFDADISGLYGGQFAESLGTEPYSALLAEGSAVTVRKGLRVPV